MNVDKEKEKYFVNVNNYFNQDKLQLCSYFGFFFY